MSAFRLLTQFEETFRGRQYRHRDSQLGNRIADFLFDDLYELDPASRFRDAVDRGVVALNPKGISPGVKMRRGDGSFGPVVPGRAPRPFQGHAVGVAPTAEVDIGVEVKILAKAMIKQIDRVISDLCRQAGHFKTKSPDAIAVGVVGLNLADRYTSYDGDRVYPTGGKGAPHPANEAPEAERRLRGSAEPCFGEFLVLPFKATNTPPYPFEWVKPGAVEDAYASVLARLLRAYERGRR
jgi:hypothetical protein